MGFDSLELYGACPVRVSEVCYAPTRMRKVALLVLLVASTAAGAQQQSGKPDRASADFAMALAYKVVPDNINVNIPLPGRVDTSCYSSGWWSFSTITCSSYVTPPTNVQFSIPRSVVYNQIAVSGDVVTTRCVSHRVNGACRWLEPNGYYRVALGASRVDIETFRMANKQKQNGCHSK